MALALYRKYRPATFAEVVGQEHVTGPLRTALAAGRINHAYLFSGPRGCGKTSSARILARSLNCERGPTPDPCGVCESCIALAPEGPGSLDVVELDAASHGGVEDTRDLRDKAFYMPAHSRYRVFIIDEAHMVSTQGFNALLKIVEEPPEHLVFIFATTEPEKVLTTIRSRTHHYPFRLLPPATLRALLERCCAEEGVSVQPAVFPLVVRAGGGSARDALSVLDQLLAGAGPEGVTYARAVALLGVTDAALLDEMVDALAAADGASVFGVVDKVVEAGHDPRRFAADMLQRLRDLIVLHAVPGAAVKGLIDAPQDQLAAMAGQSERLGAATLTRLADVLHTGLTEMRGTTSPRLVLELMCARMLLPAASLADGALLQRLERVERRLAIAEDPTTDAAASSRTPAARKPASGTTAAPGPGGPVVGLRLPAPPTLSGAGSGPVRGQASSTRPPVAAAPQPQPAAPQPQPAAPAPAAGDHEPVAAEVPPDRPSEPATSGLDVTDVRRLWSEILDTVKRQRRTTQVLLESVTVVGVSGGTLLLTMPHAGMAKRVVEPGNADVLRAAIKQVLGVDWTIRCEAADPQAGGRGGAHPGAQQSGRQPAEPGRQPAEPERHPSGNPASRRAEPAAADPPPEEDIPDDYGQESDTAMAVLRDPEESALELLASQLGARPLEPDA